MALGEQLLLKSRCSIRASSKHLGAPPTRPPEVQSGGAKTYVVVPSKVSDVNQLRAGFRVDLFTSHPASVTTSPTYNPALWGAGISRSGDQIHVTVTTGSTLGVSVSNYPVVVQKIDNQST